jgi:hypothetical protein
LSRRALALPLAVSIAGAGCIADKPADAPPAPTLSVAPVPADDAPPVAFGWTDLKGRELSTSSVRGRVTVLAFVATYDVASQAQARFLTGLSRHHVPRLNVGLVVLEQEVNRPMVEAFVDTLGIEYPVAFADAATLAGKGPFEGLHHVPSIVVLDREGRERARRLGLAKEEELEELVREVESR